MLSSCEIKRIGQAVIYSFLYFWVIFSAYSLLSALIVAFSQMFANGGSGLEIISAIFSSALTAIFAPFFLIFPALFALPPLVVGLTACAVLLRKLRLSAHAKTFVCSLILCVTVSSWFYFWGWLDAGPIELSTVALSIGFSWVASRVLQGKKPLGIGKF